MFPLDVLLVYQALILDTFYDFTHLCIYAYSFVVSGGENKGKLVLPIEVTRNHEIFRV